ncbi:MAG: hypothetical protein ABI433_12600 [Burkholderiaceae bacterium]
MSGTAGVASSRYCTTLSAPAIREEPTCSPAYSSVFDAQNTASLQQALERGSEAPAPAELK